MSPDARDASHDNGDDALERPGLGDRVGLRALFAYRELVAALVVRELTVRYKRSFFGVGWALVEPVMLVGVYVVVFGHILGAGKGMHNYALFALLGTSPWMFVSATLEQSSATLIEHAPLIRKVYFPREILIGAVVFSRLTTLLLCIALAVVIAGVTVATGETIAIERAPLVVVGIVLLTAMTFGLSLLFAGLNVILRDTNFLVRFALRIAFYGCPIVYPLSLVPASVRPIYELNPMVGVLWFFQALADPSLPAPSTTGIVAAIVGPIALFAGGVWGFRRLRSAIADLL